jgi:hypothetical protein
LRARAPCGATRTAPVGRAHSGGRGGPQGPSPAAALARPNQGGSNVAPSQHSSVTPVPPPRGLPNPKVPRRVLFLLLLPCCPPLHLLSSHRPLWAARGCGACHAAGNLKSSHRHCGGPRVRGLLQPSFPRRTCAASQRAGKRPRQGKRPHCHVLLFSSFLPLRLAGALSAGPSKQARSAQVRGILPGGGPHLLPSQPHGVHAMSCHMARPVADWGAYTRSC